MRDDGASGASRSEELVEEAYLAILGRKPDREGGEFAYWVGRLEGGLSPGRLVRAVHASAEARRRRGIGDSAPHYPDGHFYSPVVDRAAIGGYVAANRARRMAELGQIRFNPDLPSFFGQNAALILSHDFPDASRPPRRFFIGNGNFPLWDAAILRAMVALRRPRRIIEIGSGFSTACMLDACDEFGLATRFTCIDPYCDRLRSILTARDGERVEIIETEVQKVDLSVFDALGEGDILFIDSSHVLKAGSDVHFELFAILPRCRPGVLVHFHDVRFPFEYSDHMLNRLRVSWNEAYALQAFLMFNPDFEVFYWNGLQQDLLGPPEGRPAHPLDGANAGSSIWLRRLGTAAPGR